MTFFFPRQSVTLYYRLALNRCMPPHSARKNCGSNSGPCACEAGGGGTTTEVNEFKENQDVTYASLRPVQTTVLGKTAKVYLTPFSLSDYKLEQPKHSKSLSEKNSNYTMVCQKSELKKTCEEILTPKMKAIPSKAESTLQKLSLDVHTESNKSGHKSPSAATVLSADLESSDEDNTPGMDDFSGLSHYEKKRLKNISENAKFFASLQLSESAARLREMIKKRQPPKFKRKKPKKRENEIGCRRSMRLLKVNPSEISIPAPPTAPILVENENPLLPPGPLEMIPENADDNHELFKGFLQTWAEMNKTSKKMEKELSSLKSYKTNLNGMVISEDTVHKVTKGSISSVALHPSETRILVAAGSKSGQIGLWDLTQQHKEDGTYVFYPHSQPISCLYFSPDNPAHLLSLSYDGTLRCGDFSRAVFDEVYRNESRSLSSFDFLAESAATLLVGHWDGALSLVDRRTPGTSYEKLINSSMTKIRTVHMHPVHRQYFITAGLRIFDSSCVSSQMPLLTSIRHNTVTGRWLTRFQAVWDPKQEDCIIVGSMVHPRRVEVFHETGKGVHSLLGECLGSVCSINAMHPTRYVLAGGNSSGRLHVFMKPGSC
ncbi:WD repeat-containing protein 76 isoform X2 [Heterocephalus glaber]|uniref:WD repeat-containing protein 76 n=1 Tax=Heterocephalus glaber TaxID=10181 RepID=A0AAX6RP64_HETGA|nr:WD repeat-containing protein 76 isoform X2 [Heterocephalus glaber]